MRARRGWRACAAVDGRAPCARAARLASIAPSRSQQAQRRVHSIGRRRLEPFERQRVCAPRQQIENRSGEIDARDLWLAMRTKSIPGIPQPKDAAGPEARRSARPLVCRVCCDALERQAVDAALGIVTGDFHRARIDDGRHARHGQRCLRDVGRQDDSPPLDRTDRVILRLAVQRSMQRNDLDARRLMPTRLDNSARARSISRAPGRKHSTCPAVRGNTRLAASAIGSPSRVFDGQRMSIARHADDGCVTKKRGDRLDLERRRHDADAEVVACEPRLPCQRETEIGVNASFVELVEDDGCEIRKQRILLQPCGQNAFGDDEQSRIAAEALFESNLPADFAADRPAPFLRNAPGYRARGHPPRLQEDDRTCVDERRRDARGLARARRSGQAPLPACARACREPPRRARQYQEAGGLTAQRVKPRASRSA